MTAQPKQRFIFAAFAAIQIRRRPCRCQRAWWLMYSRETPMISLVALRAASARLAATGCVAPVGVISSMPSKNAGPRPDAALMIPRVAGSQRLGERVTRLPVTRGIIKAVPGFGPAYF